MEEELNQDVSSQPTNAVGPNDSGKPSDPVAQSTMTPSQVSDYYNKTQQIAKAQKELEQERVRFDQERSAWQQQRGPQAGAGYPQLQPTPQPAHVPQVPTVPQPNYAELAQQFGVEGANAIFQAFNQLAQPVQQQFAEANQRLQLAEMASLDSQIRAKGRDLYGEEWSKKGDEVMGLIVKHGLPLHLAWNAISGSEAKQAGIDAAYKAQAQKSQGNVAQQGAVPSQSVPSINSFEDAFKAALSELST